ncbi:MAG: two-component system response regulator [Gammaproteobacteria bacterium]|tara:strand:- start:82 stop:456 length:375 start_codon:yes stop_codon:yes gene_type:complete
MSTHKRTAVLIDDNESSHKFFLRSVENLSIDLKAYRSADTAMKFLNDNKPSLLFLNIILPDKNGLTFLSELRKLPLHAKTPVIILTSNDYSQDRTVASELGVLDFIVKPMSMRTINSIMLDYIK